MLDSFIRGFKMIWSSIKMGWLDKRLLIPSILTVFTNMLFSCIFFLDGVRQMGKQAGGVAGALQQHGGPAAHVGAGMPTHGMLAGLGGPSAGVANPGSVGSMFNMTQLNGRGDMSGLDSFSWDSLGGLFTTDNILIVTCLMMVWWLTNRIMEGVTSALVFSHLTEGKGTGRFADAIAAVFQSLPAIIVLGVVTLVCKKVAGFLRNRNHGGIFGAGFNMLAGMVEIFWTLAGHLILPAIVIEGCSFWGGLKRADRIAQNSLLTIGVGEVGVELICRATTCLVYLSGGVLLGGALYTQINLLSPPAILGALLWASVLVVVTALSIYIRAAFYTCLYVWALEAEAVDESERVKIKAPGPLAAALA